MAALLDQHVTAVRAAMSGQPRPARAAWLSEYADSVAASALRMGEPLDVYVGPEPGWHALRLAAVTTLARRATRRPQRYVRCAGLFTRD